MISDLREVNTPQLHFPPPSGLQASLPIGSVSLKAGNEESYSSSPQRSSPRAQRTVEEGGSWTGETNRRAQSTCPPLIKEYRSLRNYAKPVCLIQT